MISAEAAIPLQINHQGFIDVGGTPFNGNGAFRFALVDPGSGNNVWTNDASGIGSSATPTTAVSLPVINGIYNVRLGDTTLPNMTALSSPLFNDDNLGLRVWFDDGVNGVEVLSPDQPLTSAPYAFHAATADDADTLDGFEATDFVPVGDSYPHGYLYGGIISNDVIDPTNDLQISSVTCRDVSNTVNIDVLSMIKRVDATWSQGTV